MYLPTKNGGFSIAMKDEAILPTPKAQVIVPKWWYMVPPPFTVGRHLNILDAKYGQRAKYV